MSVPRPRVPHEYTDPLGFPPLRPSGDVGSAGSGATPISDEEERELLVERYAALAHTFRARPSDSILRVFDIILATLALVVLSPVLAIALGAVRLTGAPALYKGERVGRGGRVFTMIKIRTLIVDAETRLGPYIGPTLTKLTANEVTRIGRVLRATKLDELPQLWNVLRGDMSMVGPRPIRRQFFLELSREIPAYWQRLVVRPGITGLAQLRVTRETDWADKLAHDLEYIADRSPALYLHVVLTTALLMVMRPLKQGQGDLRLP